MKQNTKSVGYILQFPPLREGHPCGIASYHIRLIHYNSHPSARGIDCSRKTRHRVPRLQLPPLYEGHLLSWSDRACRSYYNSRPLREGHLAFVDIIFCLPLYCNSRPYASDISFICQHLLLQLPPICKGHQHFSFSSRANIGITTHAPLRGASANMHKIVVTNSVFCGRNANWANILKMGLTGVAILKPDFLRQSYGNLRTVLVRARI